MWHTWVHLCRPTCVQRPLPYLLRPYKKDPAPTAKKSFSFSPPNIANHSLSLLRLLDLFSEMSMKHARVHMNDVSRNVCVRSLERYVDLDTARALFAEIEANPDLKSDTVVMFGKKHIVKRRAAAYKTCTETPLSYRYAGKTMHASDAPPSILQLARRLEKDLNQPFNFVLVQAYDDGGVSIGWHSDDERDIKPDSTIASISLGATRDFQIREKVPKTSPIQTIPLRDGTLLTMEGATQRYTKHAVPVRKSQSGKRINLTFRWIKPL